MEMEIEAATAHGVNVFIYDWYWYDGRPFLEQCLNDGFLKARNNGKMKFYLMWANHDANNYWDIRLSDDPENVIWRGAVGFDEFKTVARRVVGDYFCRDNYYKIDGKPVFMIYDMNNLVNGLGGVGRTRKAIEYLDGECIRAGFSGVHLQLCAKNETVNFSGFDGKNFDTAAGLCRLFPFASATHYQFVHFADMNRDYDAIVRDAAAEWERLGKRLEVPYFPHVSIGWDNNPRFKKFIPYITQNNSPAEFEKALLSAKAYADAHPAQTPLITINSWNEWTETSYLEPDDLYGCGYLEAVKRVFGGRQN
jgi:hypothetical protein